MFTFGQVMEDNTIFKISNKIKEIRKEKGITIQEVADRAGVSKGLISQIENNRTIPSLLVLINIINALNIDLNEFFKDFNSELDSGPVVVRKKDTYSPFEKESAIGFHYKRKPMNINISLADRWSISSMIKKLA